MSENYFFKDKEKKFLQPELFGKKAEEIARCFIGEGRNGVTSSQLRRFFHQIKSMERKALNQDAPWEMIEPELLMIKAKVKYAVAKQDKFNKPYYQRMESFICDHIDRVRCKEDFFAFSKMFEAVIGYFYGYGGKDA